MGVAPRTCSVHDMGGGGDYEDNNERKRIRNVIK